jgi:hypothetical protein
MPHLGVAHMGRAVQAGRLPLQLSGPAAVNELLTQLPMTVQHSHRHTPIQRDCMLRHPQARSWQTPDSSLLVQRSTPDACENRLCVDTRRLVGLAPARCNVPTHPNLNRYICVCVHLSAPMRSCRRLCNLRVVRHDYTGSAARTWIDHRALPLHKTPIPAASSLALSTGYSAKSNPLPSWQLAAHTSQLSALCSHGLSCLR